MITSAFYRQTGPGRVPADCLSPARPRAFTAGTIRAALDASPGLVAGHSVGEITAAALAGVIDDEAALRFVHTRGLGMAEAAAVTETGMAALLGGDPAASAPQGSPSEVLRVFPVTVVPAVGPQPDVELFPRGLVLFLASARAATPAGR